jgi:ADP-ribose pyrophosphatase YjhB (NUDIX family)
MGDEKGDNNCSETILLLGILFDPKTRKILIGKREKDPHIKSLTWAFPGGRANQEEELEDTLKKKVENETGLKIENLGTIFAKTYPENRKFLAIYYLCEVIGGKENPKDDLIELKWVNPEELEKYFTTSFHSNLKEYILNLK